MANKKTTTQKKGALKKADTKQAAIKTKRAPAQKAAPQKAKGVAPQKGAKASTKVKEVPYITTDKGMKELQYHCEGIMDMIGEYILLQNPKISQKGFKTEAHDLVRMIFGISEPKALR